MNEYNNGQDPNLNSVDNVYNKETGEKIPEYSFWAEQISNNHYANFNPSTNNWDYNSSSISPAPQENVKKKSGKKVMKFIGKAICFGMVAAVSFLGIQYVYGKISPNKETAVESNENTDVQEKLNIDRPSRSDTLIESTESEPVVTTDKTVISNVADNTMPAIVSIKSTSNQAYSWFGEDVSEPAESSGSGIIVGKDDKELLIATNNHVVEGSDKLMVTFIDGSEVEAVIKGTDATADLAVISVKISDIKKDTLSKIQVAKLGSSDDIKVGEMAIAIGNALGYGQSLTVGYISAKDRKVEISDGYNSKTMVLLQTDAAINPGNSGGALLNIKGEVVGINTVKYSSNEVEGMGYAIPISRATPIINELMTREDLSTEEQGYLGVSLSDVTEDVSQMYSMPIGVYIGEVVEGSPANKAGILPRDIITKLNGMEITSGMQLKDKVSSIREGTEVEITLMRNVNGNYEEKVVKVTLGKNPNAGKAQSQDKQSENE